MAEFHGHHGHVNCLAWLQKASILYAGDSKGILGAWHKKKGVWMLKQKANVVNVSETCICIGTAITNYCP